MLNEMIAVAEIRTRNALQVPESRVESALTYLSIGNGANLGSGDEDGPTDEQIEKLPELATEADERIWRDYCNEFQRFLEGALWQAGAPADAGSMMISIGPSASGGRIVSAWGIYSPTARTAYARAAAKTEAALERQPTSMALWDLWVTFKKCRAGLPMKELLAKLQPSPTVAAANWPPPSIRQAYIRACREDGDWQSIQDLVEPSWEQILSTAQLMNQAGLAQRLRERTGDTSINIGSVAGFSQGFWTSGGEAYLESFLRRGRLADAERMMNSWESNSGWPGAFLSAAAIAEKLGYDSPARAWRAKGEKK
jgi:AraC-like DNA-binding protein